MYLPIRLTHLKCTNFCLLGYLPNYSTMKAFREMNIFMGLIWWIGN